MAKLINILLQRNDCNIPWGIEIAGRYNLNEPLVINEVYPGAIAAQHISPGDIILEIQNKKSSQVADSEAERIINFPQRELQLIVLKNNKKYVPTPRSVQKSITFPQIAKTYDDSNYLPLVRNSQIKSGVEKNKSFFESISKNQGLNNFASHCANLPKISSSWQKTSRITEGNTETDHKEKFKKESFTDSNTNFDSELYKFKENIHSPSFDSSENKTYNRSHIKYNDEKNGIKTQIFAEESKSHYNSFKSSTFPNTATQFKDNFRNFWDDTSRKCYSFWDDLKSNDSFSSFGIKSPISKKSRSNLSKGNLIRGPKNRYSFWDEMASDSCDSSDTLKFDENRKTRCDLIIDSSPFDNIFFHDINLNSDPFFTFNKAKTNMFNDAFNRRKTYFDKTDTAFKTDTKKYNSKGRKNLNRRDDSLYEASEEYSDSSAMEDVYFSAEDEESARLQPSFSTFKRQTSQGSSSPGVGDIAAPPAPPPPPPPGIAPAVRIKSEIPDRRLEPPPCVQNAMMTKDKKPFTYTPGGLDLSQIRSPRMARRINRNAQSEGVSEVPRPPPQPTGALPPSALAAMQPQLPIQVFPTGGAPNPPPPPPPPCLTPAPPVASNGFSQTAPPAPVNNTNYQRPDIKIPSNPTTMLRQTQGPNRSPPSLGLQDSQPQNELPKPQLGSIYIPPLNNQEAQQRSGPQTRPVQSPPGTPQRPSQSPQSPPVSPQRSVQSPGSPQSPLPTLNKAPTPWLNQRPQQQQNLPSWVNREETQPPVQSKPISQSQQSGSRIIPIHIEGQEKSNHQQQMKPTVQPVQQSQTIYQQQQTNYQQTQQSTTRIIPIQIEGASNANGHQQVRSPQYNQAPQWTPSGNSSPQPYQQPRSAQQIPTDQMRKMELSDDDRALMNKFRNQVDEDSFLHNESDPRYRGAAIPSRAFRMLQSMTDTQPGIGALGPQYPTVPRGSPGVRGPPKSQVQQEEPAGQQVYIPPSEQQVVEPRKYTGAAIPSRSFRILQAMTSPENCGPGQSDL